LGRKVELRAAYARGIDPFTEVFFKHKTGIFGNLVENKSLPFRYRALFTDADREEKRSLSYYGAWVWLRLLNKLYVKHTIDFELTRKSYAMTHIIEDFCRKLGANFLLKAVRVDFEMFFPIQQFTAYFVITFCIKKIQMGFSPKHVLNYLKKSFEAIEHIVAGYRFIIAGRFNRRDRAFL